jgi:hypothetical protein
VGKGLGHEVRSFKTQKNVRGMGPSVEMEMETVAFTIYEKSHVHNYS